MNILVIGTGQIGSAIREIEADAGNSVSTVEKDIAVTPGKDYKFCHVCIPYSPNFAEIIADYLVTYQPDHIIIHSTVAIGTTAKIKKIPGFHGNVVYSPCMGVHPNLKESIKTFIKIVGGDMLTPVLSHLREIGIVAKPMKRAEDAEAAKLFSTTYYYWNIEYMRQVHKFCEENGLNFDEVYTSTNEIYNLGYTDMGMKNVRRPILKYMGEKTLGHCLVPNVEILKDSFLPAKYLSKREKSE